MDSLLDESPSLVEKEELLQEERSDVKISRSNGEGSKKI